MTPNFHWATSSQRPAHYMQFAKPIKVLHCSWTVMPQETGGRCDEDKQRNERNLIDGKRLLSAYRTSLGADIVILTTEDRSCTMIMLSGGV